MAHVESARTPRGATTRLKKLSAEDRGASLIAVASGRPQPQARSSYIRFNVALRASAVVLRHRRSVRLAGSVMMPPARASIAGHVRRLWIPFPIRGGPAVSGRGGYGASGISARG